MQIFNFAYMNPNDTKSCFNLYTNCSDNAALTSFAMLCQKQE